jgi:hypothetical protein
MSGILVIWWLGMVMQARMEANVAHTWQLKVTHGATCTQWASLRSRAKWVSTWEGRWPDNVQHSTESAYRLYLHFIPHVKVQKRSLQAGDPRREEEFEDRAFQEEGVTASNGRRPIFNHLPSCRNSAFTCMPVPKYHVPHLYLSSCLTSSLIRDPSLRSGCL